MQRQIHSLPGLVLGILVVLACISGAILSVSPALERLRADVPAKGAITLAELAERVVARYPETEAIERRPSGQIVVSYFDGGNPAQLIVDPVTAEAIAPHRQSRFTLWLSEFHRALLMGDAIAGRAAVGLGAVGVLFLATSGAVLLHDRMGGWRMLRQRVRGTRAQRAHILMARATAPALVLAALTGAYLSLSSFGLIPDGKNARPQFPSGLDGGPPAPIGTLQAFQGVDLRDFRQLIFPFDADPAEPFELLTARGAGFVDQATGEPINWLPHSGARRLRETVFMLHTGQGIWWFALLTGLGVMGGPAMAVTGAAIWWRRRGAMPRIRRNIPLKDADTVILVGSEGNTTWGFAYTLQDALSAAGHFVHVAAMNDIDDAHTGNRRMFILTATYGDGSAPASASRFLDRLERVLHPPEGGFAILGFGDSEFDHFCQYALEVEQAVLASGWTEFAPLETINRQSAQEFARWGRDVGAAIGVDLRLAHIAENRQARPFQLTWREDYGAEVAAPTAILRFAVPDGSDERLVAGLTGRRRLPHFEAGDLFGVLPPESAMPRYYSLGSATEDGFLEISVRKHTHGLCSGFLHGLQPGDRIKGFVRPNPEFHLKPGKTPVILVAAGCGVGPAAGFIRANDARRPMRLYFGARDPASDFLYRNEMKLWLAEGKLSALIPAFSRGADRAYLQDKIVADAEVLRAMIANGASVMVVGGREMAQGAAAAMDQVMRPLGVNVARLKAEERYVEDIF